MPAHKHAENMRLYAEDAAEIDKPWTRWQFCTTDTTHTRWFDSHTHPMWCPFFKYRRKPKSSRERFDEWAMSEKPFFEYSAAWKAWQEAKRQAKEALAGEEAGDD